MPESNMQPSLEMQEFMQEMSRPVVPHMPFEEYAEKFKDGFILTRKNSICEIRMHTNNKSAFFGNLQHHGWSQILQLVGADPENEVIIITGTGEDFVREIPHDLVEAMLLREVTPEMARMQQLNQFNLYIEGNALIKAVMDYIHVPTIGVVNGPAGAMSALATLCDITICSDTATFEEAHFAGNLVPADGTWQAYEGLLGVKRACYMAYTHQIVDAKTALDWGIVNEVVPHKLINERGWEIAEKIMKTDKYVRRLTHTMVKDYYGKMVNNLAMQFGTEAFGNAMVTANRGHK